MSSPFLLGKLLLTTDERNALGSVLNGTMIYNKTTSALQIYIDGNWQTLADSTVTNSLVNDINNVQDAVTSTTTQLSTIGDVVNCYQELLSFSDGGTFTSGAWRTRTLNAIYPSDSGWASIASNQLTLQPGRYILSGWGVYFNVGENMMAIYDVTNATYIQYGPRMADTTAGLLFNVNHTMSIPINISVATTYELHHRCGTTAGSGFGYPSAWIDVNRYCGFNITRME